MHQSFMVLIAALDQAGIEAMWPEVELAASTGQLSEAEYLDLCDYAS